MTAKRRAALGIRARTGRAIVVALGGAVEAPEILGKTRIDVAVTFEEGAVFHMGQEMEIEAARAFILESEGRFTTRARADLGAFVRDLGAKIVGARLVAADEKPLPAIEKVLKVHPLVHAAEAELYRRVFTQAAAAVGPRPARVAEDLLGERAAAGAELTPAKLNAHLAALGKTSGKPWAAEQKQAALAAWIALANAQHP